jgi:LacI family transcriptional regulator
LHHSYGYDDKNMKRKKIGSMQKPVKRVTMKDISKKAGVSVGTVDRALNNSGRINAETKARVLAVAKELNYQRNEVARALRVQKRINILAIYHTQPEYYTQYFSAGLEKAQESLSGFGLQLNVIRADTLDPTDILKVTNGINIKEYDGILLNAGGPELDEFIDGAVSKGVPVATFNSDSPSSRRLFFSGENHFQAGRMSGELVSKLMCGKGNVSLFSGLSSVYALKERVRGFLNYITENYPDISIVGNINHGDDEKLWTDKARELLYNNPLPDAIFCNSASGAYPICKLLSENPDIKRPAVVGYDYDARLEPMLEKNICTALIFQNPQKQAANALRLLFDYINGDIPVPSSEDTIIVPTIIIKNNIELCKL